MLNETTPKAEKLPTIAVHGIKKAFGSNMVLKGVDMDVMPGEVVALVGGNGAGKSTLVKIMMGIYQSDEGTVFVNGVCERLAKPSASLACGIYLVPQEPMLFPNMNVEENVLMGFTGARGPLSKRLGELMQHLGWELDLERKAATLSIAEQQLVEILRGLMHESKLLILDEPTSSLTFKETEALFCVIEELKKKDIGIIYITHRLTEVFRIATRVMIMRDGVITLSGPVSGFTKDMLVEGLLPANAKTLIKSAGKPVDYESLKPILEVNNLSGYGFEDISLKVYPGEILGLAGVVGAGRTELATTIFGRDVVKSGKVLLGGKDITGLSTRRVLDEGLNYVAEDRFLHGIFRISDVCANVTASNLDKMSGTFLNKREENKVTDTYIEAFRTKVTGRDQLMGSLSGGNQQKVVLSRALNTTPKVLILDEPTRGIDAASRGDVYAIIEKLKNEGLGILLISSDMEEIIELSDRAVTMYSGRINREFTKDQINHDALISAAFGVPEGKASNA